MNVLQEFVSGRKRKSSSWFFIFIVFIYLCLSANERCDVNVLVLDRLSDRTTECLELPVLFCSSSLSLPLPALFSHLFLTMHLSLMGLTCCPAWFWFWFVWTSSRLWLFHPSSDSSFSSPVRYLCLCNGSLRKKWIQII